MGGTGVLMQGGLHPDLKIEWFERLLTRHQAALPADLAALLLRLRRFSPLPSTATFPFATRSSACAMPDSIPSRAAARRSSTTRSAIASPGSSARPKSGCCVHRTAHQLGMRTTATMMFGVGETFEHRVNHFELVRRLQEETGGFTAFIPWSFQPDNTALGGRGWDEATSVEYLKVLAIARLYLDNIENVQSSWVTQG